MWGVGGSSQGEAGASPFSECDLNVSSSAKAHSKD